MIIKERGVFMKANFNDERMYTYLKGYAMGKGLPETMKALNYARRLHKGQVRKGGEPYIVHPLTMACQAISLGIDDDDIISAILLHDVVEDCGVSINDLPVNNTIKHSVELLSFNKPDKYLEKDGIGPSINVVKTHYYEKIADDRIAIIAKLIDRCHNVSSMAGVFTKEKIKEYIDETELFVIPLIREAKENYPEYQNVLFILKYHIFSVLDAIQSTMQTYNN